MNKIFSSKECYIPVRQDASRVIVSYGCVPEPDGIYATWYEIYFYKKPYPVVTFEMIKEAIIADINAQTDEKILTGFVWEDKQVWLSSENQFNFKAAYDLAIQTQGASLPVKFKLGEADVEVGEDEYGMPIREKQPVYHTFETVEELTDFYTKAIAHINQCLNEGWEMKDSIDWSQYEINTTEA